MTGARWVAAAIGGGVTAAAYAVGRRLPLSARARWERINHAGRTVTLLEGPAHVVGLAVGSALAGPGPVVAALGSGALGALDDLAGDTASKGLRGHLRAAREGRITTGLVKIGGLGVVGLVASGVQGRRATRAPSGLVEVAVGGAVIAGSANLLNLFDLRPGRALKVGLLVGLPVALSRARRPGQTSPRRVTAPVAGGAAAGAALAVLPPDLRGESMLGDTGANALGAVLGTALIEGRSLRMRLALLTVIGALTLLSEKVSFTEVIESTPVLREFDEWGRSHSMIQATDAASRERTPDMNEPLT